MSNFKILSSKYISQHKYFTAREDSYETPAGKIVDPYFVVELPESAAALALTETGEAVMIKQYRHPIGKECIEIPGGFIDDKEDKEIALKRELLEETGHHFSAVFYLGYTYGNPGVLNNKSHLFLALGGIKSGEQKLDDNEEIEILFKTLPEIKEMLSAGDFAQSLHEVCIRRAFEHPALKNHPALQE